MTKENGALMPVDNSLVREKVAQDKLLAIDVLNDIKQRLVDFIIEPAVRVDMAGGNAGANRDHIDFKHAQHAALRAVQDGLYIERVDTEFRENNDSRERFLFTKARLQVSILNDRWSLLPWTNPLLARFKQKRPGETAEIPAPNDGRSPTHHKILEAVKFGQILPTVLRAEYQLEEGDVFVVDEKELDAPRPVDEYRVTEGFGLGEIIELADATQYQAMQLPFAHTVLIEGPPGSGKTSIALMRIPCLIDQQWNELGLHREQGDPPFHTKLSVRVLVMNEEMIEYLQRMIRHPSIGLDYVPVLPLTDFCRDICRDAGVLMGIASQETPALTNLKLHPMAIPAIAAGFQKWVRRRWDDAKEAFAAELTAMSADAGGRVVQSIGRWVDGIVALAPPNVTWEGAPNLAASLHSIFVDEKRRLGTVSAPRGGMSLQEQMRYESEQREKTSALAALRALFEHVALFVKSFFDRKEIVNAMVATPKFEALLRTFTDEGRVVKSDLKYEWVHQTLSQVQKLSKGDFALTAWLAAHVAMTIDMDGSKPAFGGVAPRLTHAVIDEAQDVALAHVGLLRRLLHRDGTVTLVGDLRQRVSHRGHFASWQDFGLTNITRAIFRVNYRQSKPLGDYVGAIHTRLFGEPPAWRTSERPGPKPRMRRLLGIRDLNAAIAKEVSYWRREMPGSTVAVLYHGRWGGAKKMKDELEVRLHESIDKVHLARV
jgi:hypothetical protein